MRVSAQAKLLVLCYKAAVGWAAQQNSSGSPGCPCISPWAVPLPSDSRTNRELLINRKHVLGINNQTLVRVPLDYGASVCRAWDNATHHSDCLRPDGRPHDSRTPEWCLARWCYVNTSQCDRPYDQTDHAVRPADTVDGLHHSYETCGNLNAYTDEKHYAKLRGLHLRVSMPGDSGSGYTLTTLPDGTRAGSVVSFMKSVAQEASFTWEIVPIGDSRSLFSSSFTACVHAVALGATDLCIGNFWLTTQRMLIHSSFTSVLYDDEMVLVVKATEDVNLWERIGVPFTSTLTPTAWIAVLGTTLFMSFAMQIIEGKEVGDGAKKVLDKLAAQSVSNDQAQRKMRMMEKSTLHVRRIGICECSYDLVKKKFEQYGKVMDIQIPKREDAGIDTSWALVMLGTADAARKAMKAENEKAEGLLVTRYNSAQAKASTSEMKKVAKKIEEKLELDADTGVDSKASTYTDFVKTFVVSAYYGLLGLTAGAPQHEGHASPAGSVAILGFAVFGVLFLASFTGATAAELIAKNERSGELSSVSDVQHASGAKLCVMVAMQARFLLRYPSMDGRLVSSKTSTTVMQDMDDGKCVGAIMFQDAWENCLTGACPTPKNDGSSKALNHCDKVAIGGSLLSTSNVMPVRHDLREALAYMISRRVANNEYANFRQKAREQFLGPNLCPEEDVTETNKAQIDGHAMAGPVAISLMCTAAGLMVHYLVKYRTNRRLSGLFVDNDSGKKYLHDSDLHVLLNAMGVLDGVGRAQSADVVKTIRKEIEIETGCNGKISISEFQTWAQTDEELGRELNNVMQRFCESPPLHTAQRSDKPEPELQPVNDARKRTPNTAKPR
eukprot:COSAG01_NODE_4491_length_4978_cov_17.492109_1_plen_836_part_10